MAQLASRPGYRPDIQGLRGVAVLLVVLFHAGLPVYGGYIGVDVFFVISGFVITRGIVRKLHQGQFSFKDFYIKRMRRLFPALVTMLAVVLLLMPLLGPPEGFPVSERTALGATFFNANNYLILTDGYFAAAAESNLFLHTWSLSLEEQFYFFFPLMMFLLWRIGPKNSEHKAVFWGIIGVCLLSFGAGLYLSFGGSFGPFNGRKVAFFTIITRAWQFGVGALLAMRTEQLKQSFLVSNWSAWFGFALILIGSVLFDHTTVFPGVAALVPTFGAALMIVAWVSVSSHDDSVLYRVMSSPQMVRIGDLSYSWYLWHWPIIVFAIALFPRTPVIAGIAGAVISYPVTVLSERYIETPIRFRAKERRWPALVMLVFCMVLPVLAWGGNAGVKKGVSLLSSQHSNFIMIHKVFEVSQEYRAIGCDGDRTPMNPDPDCVFNKNGQKTVVLVGDSNARQWIPMLKTLVPSMDAKLIASTHSACRFLDVAILRNGKEKEECLAWRQRTLADLMSMKPDVVLITSAIDQDIWDETHQVRDSAGRIYDAPNEKAMAISQSMERIAQEMIYQGTRVIYIEPIPKFVRYGKLSRNEKNMQKQAEAMSLRCSVLNLLVYPAACTLQRDLNDARYPAPSEISAMFNAAGVVGAYLADPAVAICPDLKCSSIQFDPPAVVYINDRHITPDGARLGRPIFEEVLREALKE